MQGCPGSKLTDGCLKTVGTVTAQWMPAWALVSEPGGLAHPKPTPHSSRAWDASHERALKPPAVGAGEGGAGGWHASLVPASGGTGSESRAGGGTGPHQARPKRAEEWTVPARASQPETHWPASSRRVSSEAAKAWRDSLAWVPCTGSPWPPPAQRSLP